MKNLILIGGGGHCKSCIDVIEQEGKYNIKGILDTPEKIGQEVLGYKIIGTDNDIKKYIDNCLFLITIGYIKTPDLRIKIFNQIKELNGKLATIISPRAYVSKYAKIEEGTIVHHNAFINANVSIGKNCIINTASIIEHDCIVKDNCHIAIGAKLCGDVTIKEKTFIGANSLIVQQKIINENSFIKAQSLVK